MADVSFRFILSKDDYESYTAFLQKGNLSVAPPQPLETPPEETTLVDAKFVELIAVMVAGAVSAMVLRLFDLLVQKQENGTVIDFSKHPPEFSTVSNLPYGTLVVITPGNEPLVKKIDPNQTVQTQRFITDMIEKYAQK